MQRCDVLERSYASAARQKMRELESTFRLPFRHSNHSSLYVTDLNFAVHVDIFGRSYLDDVLVHIEDRLVEARALGKSRLRVALSGPREQVDNEIKPLVRNHFKGYVSSYQYYGRLYFGVLTAFCLQPLPLHRHQRLPLCMDAQNEATCAPRPCRSNHTLY